MNKILCQDAIYKPNVGLMVQHSIVFADYPTVIVALSDPSFNFSSLDDMAMMVSKRGELFELNLLGAFVWELMNGTHTIDAIENSIMDIFSIDKHSAHRDLVKLIETMVELDLVCYVSP